MEVEKFNNIVNTRLDSCKEILVTKAEQYATSKDRLHNFKDGACVNGCTTKQYALTLVTKHFIALRDKINRDEYVSEEFVSEKITDIINYMLLIEALIEEEKNG